mmetsp:Transcript_9038/g.22919  ORF Transcript_9038/g.22919 Transcript_9038/m.22919 type:complete len:167 (-) Transcript_9038:179-679(-)
METSAGLPDDTCDPFLAENFHGCDDACVECLDYDAANCDRVKNYRTYSSLAHGLITGEAEMKRAITTGGPIECMLLDSVPSFEDYDGDGIICNPTNDTGRNHDVELVGFGVDGDVPYWIGRNSWGTSWGDGGWFKLCRGTNNLGIESEGCAWVTPLVGDAGPGPSS